MTTVAAPQLEYTSHGLHHRKRLFLWNGLALVAVSVALRVWLLGRLPGVNGDEAWMGVQAQRWLRGSIAWRTPTGNLINPFFFVPEVVLHALFRPSFTLLRVPAVISGLLA